jgi:multidrug transporter EmrE-like cation transporter
MTYYSLRLTILKVEKVNVKLLVYIFPVAILVAYSQLVVKWRSSVILLNPQSNLLDKLVIYFSDPMIASAYLAALLGSFAWLFVVTKLPLSIGFPVYIGVTFLLVILGSWLFLGENISAIRLLAVCFIFIGVTLGGVK